MRLYVAATAMLLLSACGGDSNVPSVPNANVVLEDSTQYDSSLFQNDAQREQELRNQVFALALKPETFNDTLLWCRQLKAQYGTLCGCEKLGFADIGKLGMLGSEDSVVWVHLRFKLDSVYHAQQFAFNLKGNLMFQAEADTWRMLPIFTNQTPVLVLASESEETPNHHLYKLENEQFIDMMDEFSDNLPRTMGSNNTQFAFEPNELKLTLEDVDKDSMPDLVFAGKKVYYDKKVKSENLRYTFLYKKSKEMFIYKNK